MDLNEKISSVIKYIKHLHGITIIPVDSIENVEEYYKTFLFHENQHYKNFVSLSTINYYISQNCICHTIDPLLVNCYFFSINGTTFMLGPLTNVLMSERDAVTILNYNLLHDLKPQQLLAYYDTLPSIKDSLVIAIINAMIETINPLEPQKNIKIYDARKIISPALDDQHDDNKNSAYTISQRYLFEQQFISNIKLGNYKSAMNNLHSMEESVLFYKRIGNTLENERTGCAITRTTVRLAAYQAGLPPDIINEICINNIKELIKAKTLDDIYRAKKNMIGSFCREIQSQRENNYSSTVQSILYYINRNYMNPINLDSLSTELNLDKSYIVCLFKKELGITPIAYLTETRMKQAEILLHNKNLTITDISYAVGILDSNYFVKLFKKQYGVTPSHYRNHTN